MLSEWGRSAPLLGSTGLRPIYLALYCSLPSSLPTEGEASSMCVYIYIHTLTLQLVSFKLVSHEFSLFGSLKQL